MVEDLPPYGKGTKMSQMGRDAPAQRRGVAGPMRERKQVMFAYMYMSIMQRLCS